MERKFFPNDHVRILNDRISCSAGTEAVLIGSYADLYWGNNHDCHSAQIKGGGTMAWLYDSELELIERDRPDLKEQWARETADDCERQSKLDWIFENGPDVAARKCRGAAIAALGKCMGIDNMWPSGEGIEWAMNEQYILACAAPWLMAKDKNGWLKTCEEFKEYKRNKTNVG